MSVGMGAVPLVALNVTVWSGVTSFGTSVVSMKSSAASGMITTYQLRWAGLQNWVRKIDWLAFYGRASRFKDVGLEHPLRDVILLLASRCTYDINARAVHVELAVAHVVEPRPREENVLGVWETGRHAERIVNLSR